MVPVQDRILNFGMNKNYKTKVIQERWEKERAKWLNPKSHEVNNKFVEINGEKHKKNADPRDGVIAKALPMDHKEKV